MYMSNLYVGEQVDVDYINISLCCLISVCQKMQIVWKCKNMSFCSLLSFWLHKLDVIISHITLLCFLVCGFVLYRPLM